MHHQVVSHSLDVRVGRQHGLRATRHPQMAQFDSARHEGEKTLRVCGEARWATGERRAWAWAESETGGGEGRAHSLSRVGFEGGNPRGRTNYRGSGRRARWRAGA